MLRSRYTAHPTLFGQSWIVPGLRKRNLRMGRIINPDPKVQQYIDESERQLAMLRGQPAAPSPEQKQAADKQQIMAALSQLLKTQSAPSAKGTVSAKNLDFAKPYQ